MLNEKKIHQMIEMKKTEQGLKKQKGASMIEYALVVAAVVGIAAVVFGDGAGLNKAITDKVNAVATEINTPPA